MGDKREEYKLPIGDKVALTGGGIGLSAFTSAIGATIGLALSDQQELPTFKDSIEKVASEEVRTIEGASGKIMTNAEVLAEFEKKKDLETQRRDTNLEGVREANRPSQKTGVIVGTAAGAAVVPIAVGAVALLNNRRKKEEEQSRGGNIA